MRVLVTGGAGYVGCVLVKELLDQGYSVRVLDKGVFGFNRLNDISDKIALFKEDIRDHKALDLSLTKVNAVIHLGGLSNDPTAEYDTEETHEVNVEGTKRLADACKSHGVQRFVYASTASIYDRGVIEEQEDMILDETSWVNPCYPYSRSKLEAERYLLNLADKHFCPVILRKGTIYGFSPKMRYDLVVNAFIKDAFIKKSISLNYIGQMWRPLVDIDDVAKIYCHCLVAPEDKVKGEIFNVLHKNYRISELALIFKDIMLQQMGAKVDVKINHDIKGIRNYRLSGRKLFSRLGIKPLISIENSVKNMLQKIQEYDYTDFSNPWYYNMAWLNEKKISAKK